MALADIQEKILKEAQAEAEQILKSARAAQSARQKAVEKELAAQLKEAQAYWQKQMEREFFQQTQLLELDNKRQYLAAKRQSLGELEQELIAKILGDEDLLSKFLQKLFSGLSKEFPNAEVLRVSKVNYPLVQKLLAKTVKIEEQAWPAGRLELIAGKTKIDLTIADQVKEYFKRNEQTIARELFDE